MMKLISGEMVTAFELLTQGLALFITLVTLWRARPLKMTMELKYLLGGLVGFGLAVPAGIIQADMGLNRVLHNTQWIIGAHVHVALLVGLYMTLYSAVYVLWSMLTNNTKLYSMKLANAHFWLDLKAYQWYIYGFFALSILWAWLFAKKERKKYETNNARYEKLYEETLALIDTLEREGCVKKENLYIESSDEHI